VVAAPDFPHTSSNGGDGNRGDIVNQPADLVAVLDAIVAGAVPEVPAIAHPDRVAVMGHSDGGLTVSALAFNTQYRDPRIAAAVVMTGGRALFPGSYFAPGSPPLLAVHGTADETNPISASVSLWRDLPAGIPGYLVRIDGGSHLGPYLFDTGLPALGEVVADFLDAHLVPSIDRHADEGAVTRLERDAGQAPLSIESR
jgi:predicted dienelactone hydrolase